MTLPGLIELENCSGADTVYIACKPALLPFWRVTGREERCLVCPSGFKALVASVHRLRGCAFDRAFVLPRSPRAAFLAFASGAKWRRGPRGERLSNHLASFFLSDLVGEDPATHQIERYGEILLGQHLSKVLPPPRIAPPIISAPPHSLEPLASGFIALIPGAARGPSKQWPAERFAKVGDLLARELKVPIVLLGAPSEAEVCGRVAHHSPSDVLNLAGKLTFDEWVYALSKATVVVCNDSGGMHLSAALGRPTVGIFGITDPAITGARGDRVALVQNSTIRSRKVARVSPEAEQALSAVTVEMVMSAALGLLTDIEELAEV